MPNISAGANLTSAALAAVDLATQAVNAALRSADLLTAKANISQEVRSAHRPPATQPRATATRCGPGRERA